MGEKTMPVTGGCLCGAIRYESTEPPNWVVCCHCRICQQAYGGLFGIGLEFPGKAFRYTKGEVTYYQSSSWSKRGFCANCGSPVDMWYKDDPDGIVFIGTLDHPEDWPQEKHVGIESKVSWYVINDGLPQRRTDVSQHVEDVKAQEFYSARESSRLGDRGD